MIFRVSRWIGSSSSVLNRSVLQLCEQFQRQTDLICQGVTICPVLPIPPLAQATEYNTGTVRRGMSHPPALRVLKGYAVKMRGRGENLSFKIISHRRLPFRRNKNKMLCCSIKDFLCLPSLQQLFTLPETNQCDFLLALQPGEVHSFIAAAVWKRPMQESKLTIRYLWFTIQVFFFFVTWQHGEDEMFQNFKCFDGGSKFVIVRCLAHHFLCSLKQMT